MQSIGLQTVLQMSSAVERVQQVAQSHGAVASEQYKDVLDKETLLKRTEVQKSETKDEVGIKEEDKGSRNQQEKQETKEEPGEKELSAGQKTDPEIHNDDIPQGRLLNIRA